MSSKLQEVNDTPMSMSTIDHQPTPKQSITLEDIEAVVAGTVANALDDFVEKYPIKTKMEQRDNEQIKEYEAFKEKHERTIMFEKFEQQLNRLEQLLLEMKHER